MIRTLLALIALTVFASCVDEAPAVSEPVYTGHVQIRTDVASRWNVKQAVKDAKLTNVTVKAVPADQLGDCNANCVLVWSDPKATNKDGFTTSKAVEVSKWYNGNVMLTSSVSLSDNWGKKHTKAQRATLLRDAIKKAVPR